MVPLVAASLAGMPADDHTAPGNIFQNSAIPYRIPNVKTVCHRLETTPFRPSWIRTPGRMQNTYANECFMDELAAAAGADPIEFRLKYLDPNDKRGIEVLNRAGRPGEVGQAALAASNGQSGDVVTGRGVTYVQIRAGAHLRGGRSPRSRSTARPARSACRASTSRTTAGRSSIRMG